MVFGLENILEKALMKNFLNEENDSFSDPQLDSIYICTTKNTKTVQPFRSCSWEELS